MKAWNLSISISYLAALVTLDIPGEYMTAHCNNITHSDTCLFLRINTIVSFYCLSLERHCLVQVTIRFHKRGFDYIDICKIHVLRKKIQEAGSQKSYNTTCQSSLLLFSCVNLKKSFNISGPLCSSVKCGDEALLLPRCSQADSKTGAHRENLKLTEDVALKQSRELLEL